MLIILFMNFWSEFFKIYFNNFLTNKKIMYKFTVIIVNFFELVLLFYLKVACTCKLTTVRALEVRAQRLVLLVPITVIFS